MNSNGEPDFFVIFLHVAIQNSLQFTKASVDGEILGSIERFCS
jgi:hypothetical protein